jgi:hypothetical protein
MNLLLHFNVFPALRAGETVFLVKRWLWMLSAKSFPSYHVFVSMPPVCDACLYVTNRRILVVASVLRLITQEISLWKPGEAESADQEVIQRVDLGRSVIFGPFLEVVSTCTAFHWLRSSEARIRLYMRNAESAYRLITRGDASPWGNET